MAGPTSDQFLLSCIKNSDLTKIDFAKVVEDTGVTTVGAATKRYSRWKAKVQAELDNPEAAAEGDGSASPKKAQKSPVKKAAKADGGETPKKKTPAKKATSARKRKLDGEEVEPDKVKDEPEEEEES